MSTETVTKDASCGVLPDKPSELIRLAIKDLETCEASEKYAIFMGAWHEPVDD